MVKSLDNFAFCQSLYCWEGKEKVKLLILRRELITILQLTIWDQRCAHLIPSPGHPSSQSPPVLLTPSLPPPPSPPHPLSLPLPPHPVFPLCPSSYSPPSLPLSPLPLSPLSPYPRLPLSISAPFYGYLKLLKLNGKERSRNKDLRSDLRIELQNSCTEGHTPADWANPASSSRENELISSCSSCIQLYSSGQRDRKQTSQLSFFHVPAFPCPGWLRDSPDVLLYTET